MAFPGFGHFGLIIRPVCHLYTRWEGIETRHKRKIYLYIRYLSVVMHDLKRPPYSAGHSDSSLAIYLQSRERTLRSLAAVISQSTFGGWWLVAGCRWSKSWLTPFEPRMNCGAPYP